MNWTITYYDESFQAEILALMMIKLEEGDKMPQSSNVSVYQFKVTLNGSKPPIWRRIQVRSDTTLYKLHRILQVVMGWSDYHLHQFVIRGDAR